MLPGLGRSAIVSSSPEGNGAPWRAVLRAPREVGETGGLLPARGLLDPRADDVGDRGPRRWGGGALDGVPRPHLALPDDAEVEPGPPALEEPVLDVLATEPDPELEAREPGVRRLEDGGPDTVPVPEMHVRFEEPLGRQVLPEHAPGERHLRELRSPEFVVLARVAVHRLARSPVAAGAAHGVPEESRGPRRDTGPP